MDLVSFLRGFRLGTGGIQSHKESEIDAKIVGLIEQQETNPFASLKVECEKSHMPGDCYLCGGDSMAGVTQ